MSPSMPKTMGKMLGGVTSVWQTGMGDLKAPVALMIELMHGNPCQKKKNGCTVRTESLQQLRILFSA
jgi:hypothetical protein